MILRERENYTIQCLLLWFVIVIGTRCRCRDLTPHLTPHSAFLSESVSEPVDKAPIFAVNVKMRLNRK